QYYFPLWLIRDILEEMHGDMVLVYLEGLDVAPGILLDLIPLSKKIDMQELLQFQTCRTLIRYSPYSSEEERKQAIADPAEAFRKEVHIALNALREWIDTKGKEVYLHAQLAKHDKEIRALADKFESYKKK